MCESKETYQAFGRQIVELGYGVCNGDSEEMYEVFGREWEKFLFSMTLEMLSKNFEINVCGFSKKYVIKKIIGKLLLRKTIRRKVEYVTDIASCSLKECYIRIPKYSDIQDVIDGFEKSKEKSFSVTIVHEFSTTYKEIDGLEWDVYRLLFYY